MIHFVMPPDGMEPSLVEELFRPQAHYLRQVGHSVSLVGDSVFSGAGSVTKIPVNATIVYRGWMVRPDEYKNFERAVRAAQSSLLSDSATYCLTHHLPNWYPLLKEFTAETVTISSADELIPTLSRLKWGQYFLNDFVKSLKVDGGSIVRNSTDAERWLHEMLQYRDELE